MTTKLTLEELRERIAKYAPIVDTPVDKFAHNIINIDLSIIAENYGVAAANEVIEDYDLESLGWSKKGRRMREIEAEVRAAMRGEA